MDLSWVRVAQGRRTALLAAVCVLVPPGVSFGQPPATYSQGFTKGAWGPLIPTDQDVPPVHAVLLRTGNVLCNPDVLKLSYQLYYSATYGVSSKYPVNNGADLYCSGHSKLLDGRVFFAGGTDNTASIYDPDAPPSTAYTTVPAPPVPPPVPDRYYPTTTVLADGRILIIADSGRSDASLTPEVFDPVAASWTQLSGAKVCNPSDPLCLATAGAANFYVPLYPFLFQLTSGKILYAGTSEEVPPTPDGVYVYARTLEILPQQWQRVIATSSDPITGESAVMYGIDKVMKAGGKDQTVVPVQGTFRVCRIDMSSANPHWIELSTLAHHGFGYASEDNSSFYLVTLPNGNILALGGYAQTGEETPELLDPSSDSNLWVDMNGTTYRRGYHSTALVLPDGSVFFASGKNPDDERTDAQIFYPPYFYKSNDQLIAEVDRPQVSGAPTLVATGSTFTLQVQAGSDPTFQISKVALMRLGSVTHSFDQDTRYVPLAFSPTQGLITVTAPTSAEAAPPGHYMLFAVNNDHDRPSKAKFVQVWGIPQASLLAQYVTIGIDSFDVTISWKTNIAATSGDDATFYRPNGPVAGARLLSSSISSDGRQHTAQWRVRSNPCPVSEWWEFQSTSSTLGTTSKSLRSKFPVKYCVDG